MPTANNMQMQVSYTLSTIFSVVDDNAETIWTLLLSNLLRNPHQMTDQLLLFFLHTTNAYQTILRLRDDKRMKWRLWVDVLEAICAVVLVDARAGNFFAEEFVENSWAIRQACRLSFGNFVGHTTSQQ